ncbi:MAG: hypothetical protein ACRDD2_02305 [Sarcina sp.]
MYTYSKHCIKYSIKDNSIKKGEVEILDRKENKIKEKSNLNELIQKDKIAENFMVQNRCHDDFYCDDYCNRKTIYQGEIEINQAYNGNNIAYKEEFLLGYAIKQVTKTMFHFKKNHIFAVTFNTNASLLKEGFISVVPRIDGIDKDEFLGKSANNAVTKMVNVTSSFLINTCYEDLYIDFLIYSSEFKTNVLGSLSIVEIV